MSETATLEYDRDLYLMGDSLVQAWENLPPKRIKFVRSGASTVAEFPAQNLDAGQDTLLVETEYLSAEVDTDAFKAAADALEDSLFVDNGDTVDSLEAKALSTLGSASYRAFAVLALSQDYAPDVRGVAARLFAESAMEKEIETKLLTALAVSDQPLVRLGLVYGLEDNANHELLRQLAEDPHPRVRMEAQQLQART